MFEAARRDNFNKLKAIFKPYEEFLYLPEPTKNSDPCWFGFLMTIKENSPFKKQQLVDFLESNRIQTRSYFAGNILYHPGYSELAKRHANFNFPVSRLVTTNSFFLGTFIGITEEKMNYIKSVVDRFFLEYK